MVFPGIHIVCRRLIDPNLKEYQLMWLKGWIPEQFSYSFTIISEIKPILDNTKILDRKSSDKHRYTPLPGKTRPNSERNICLCLIRLNKILRIHIYPLRQKRLDIKSSNKTIMCICQVRLYQRYKIRLCLCLVILNRSLIIHLYPIRQKNGEEIIRRTQIFASKRVRDIFIWST